MGMTYTDTDAIEGAVQQIINLFDAKMQKNTPREEREDLAQSIREIIGSRTGLRTEDGKFRLYDVTLWEGEPYVYDE